MDKEDMCVCLCIYTLEYSSAIKKEWSDAICSNINEPRDYHTK